MSDTNQTEEAMFNQALGILHRLRALHVDKARMDLLALAGADLINGHGITEQHAQDIVMRAWGELDSAGQREYIDVNRTTAHMLTLVDPATGVNRVLTAADLIRLIGPAQLPAPRLIAATH